ncbi:quinol:cytochrome C oxidoreductase [Marinifilum sp. N1E240]|uniref:quinol:cytochrome C oxidoreductase n=1 Tax=Marinifilum sp. N1E240 TaxID=2608082 RepID=UPI00128AE962|nr:quinol:cytochrome C oxidoreductase [Marinifilum sp. N1E240]MPQ45724.1 quinol:cytochrome C oxidoreductase [Marinifilum sp. N1E240]
MDNNYTFSRKTRAFLMALGGIGIVLMLLGYFIESPNGQRLWTNFLINNLYFLFIALFGVVFQALHKIAYSGWHTSLQRIPEAMSAFLPISAVLMFLLYFGMHDIYHWSHENLHDPILEGKAAYLNIPFFFIRMVIYFAGWIGLGYLLRKNSLHQDLSTDVKYYKKGKLLAALFMVFFAISSSTMSWDWLMSIDAHWFSTLYGWFVFIGLFVSGIACIILMISFLKTQGKLEFINKEHIHDMGKYLFAFSIFWMYLWFSQYLLIWYSHIPEETAYFAPRLNDHTILFFTILIMNFLIPFLGLMTRNSKRNLKWLSFMAVIVLVGQWLNIYLLVIPGTIGKAAQIGIVEIGFVCLFLGGFLYVVFASLAKAPLLSKNDPLLEESFHYET